MPHSSDSMTFGEHKTRRKSDKQDPVLENSVGEPYVRFSFHEWQTQQQKQKPKHLICFI